MKRLINTIRAKVKLDRRKKNKWTRIAKEALIALTIIGFVAPISIYGQVEAETSDEFTYNLNLDTASEKIVTLQTNSNEIEIIPGESNYDRAIREKREAEAARKAKEARARRINVPSTPADLMPIYLGAQARFGVPWQLLRAVHLVESGGSGSTTRCSYAGACGPMQFIPSTWRAYGVDGNGNGVANIYDVVDAIYGAANYLAANGANRGAYTNALYRYNHSTLYVNKVLGIAKSLGL